MHSLVGHLVRHAFNKGHLVFSKAFEGDGLTTLQFMIFELISRNPGVSHAEIAQAMGTAPSVISTTLKPLLKDKFLVAKVGTPDGRKRSYYLTAAGEKWFGARRDSIHMIERELTASLSPQEIEALVASLRKIVGIGLVE